MAEAPNRETACGFAEDRAGLERRLARLDVRSLAQAGGARGEKAEVRFARSLTAALSTCFDALEYPTFPKSKAEREALDQLRSRAAFLIQALDDLDAGAQRLLEWQLDKDPAQASGRAAESKLPIGSSRGELELAEIRHDLRRICGAVFRILEEAPTARRRRQEHRALVGLVAELATIYGTFSASLAAPTEKRHRQEWPEPSGFEDFAEQVLAAIMPELAHDGLRLRELISRRHVCGSCGCAS